MASQKLTAVVAGASGLTGSFVLEKLLKDKDFVKVIVLGRKSLKKTHPKMEEHITDYSDLDSFSFWGDADVLFCCIGSTMAKAGSKEAFRKIDFDIPAELARYSETFDLDFMLISSLGADKESNNFYLRTKGEVEEAIKNREIKAIHIFRPSMLLGPRKESRFGETVGKILMTIGNPLLMGPLKKYKAIESERVAEAMILCAKKEETGSFIHENDDILKMTEDY